MKTRNYVLTGIVLFSLIMVFSSCKKEEDKNNNPQVSSVTVTPNTASANSMVTVNTVASDPDGDALTYSYTVSGGAISGNGTSASWTAPAQAGSYSVTVGVSDGNGGTASGNGSLTVTPSSP